MQRLFKIGEGILLGLLVLLLFLVAFENKIHESNWLMVVGRMHPLFLHFPIVLLFLAFITLWLPTTEETEKLFPLLRLFAALSAVSTAIMGLLLSLSAIDNGGTLQWHKWIGVTVAVLGFLFYHFYAWLLNKKKAGRIYTVLASLVVIITGHLGGNLAHGENYLLEPVQNEEIKQVPFEQAMVFEDIIKPIFKTKCGSCHGGANKKGGLWLGDSTGVIKGGKGGPLYVAGEPEMSLLLKRIHLPQEEKKHMPPINKLQLSLEEVALLNAWVRSGARFNTKVATLPEKDSFRVLAAERLQASVTNTAKEYSFGHADESTIKELNNNFRVLEPQGENSPALAVSFFGVNAYSKKSLQELVVVKKQIVSLSLSRMPVKDDELSVINQFVNLEKLNLNNTDITSKGLVQLKGLQNLREISLSGTAITAEAIEKLATFPLLHTVFIWNTKIDTFQLALLHNKFKNLKIESGFIDNGKFIVELSQPMIETRNGVFDTARMIKIKHPLKNVEIRYTLDGTAVDSSASPVYKDSFLIQASTQLIVRAFKKGWVGSTSAKAAYIKRGFIPDSVELVTPPDAKYKASGKILADADLSDLNFGNGKWLGYMNNPASVNLYFTKKSVVHSVLVNVLKRTEQFVFLPTSLEVWGGMDKSSLRLLGRINPPLPAMNEPGIMVQQLISFSPVTVKCIRIIAKPIQSLPKWHAGKGKKGWVFLSEIVVN